MQVGVKEIAEVLGGEAALGRPVRDLGDLNAVVTDGLPNAVLRQLALRLSRDDGGAAVMAVVRPRAGATRLDAGESERLERVARLWTTAVQVFGDEAAARAFLATPHNRLGGRAPLALLATELGGREVERLLDAIAYGLPA